MIRPNQPTLLLVAAAIALLLVGCGNANTSDDKIMFRYNLASGVHSLDPAFSKDQASMWVTNHLYNGLLQLDNELNVQPAIAKRWKVSDDGLTYTFYLRDDVYFHDNEAFADGKGRLVTADDVAFSLGRLIDPKTASPGAWLFSGKVDEHAPFTAVDDTTFQIKLQQPFRPLMSILTLQYTSIVPKEAVEHYGADFRSHPVGTGPFKLKVWKEGNLLILHKNERYFEQDAQGNPLPYLDGVNISFTADKHSEYLNFRKGELHFMSGLDVSYVDELLNENGELKPEWEGEIDMYKAPYLNTEYLGFLMDSTNSESPTQNKLVRQAINYGFDRVKMMQYLRNNVGKPAAAGMVPYGLPSYDESRVQGYTYDAAQCQALLAEAGYPGGKGLSTIKLMTNSNYEDMGTYIQKELEKQGIKIELELVPPAFQREKMANGEVQFFRGSWIADYPDAESYLAMFYGEHGAPPNYTRFNNGKFNAMYETAISQNDDAVRYQLYRDMDQLILEEAPVVPLYYDEVVRFVQPEVQGLEPNAMNLLSLKRVRIQ